MWLLGGRVLRVRLENDRKTVTSEIIAQISARHGVAPWGNRNSLRTLSTRATTNTGALSTLVIRHCVIEPADAWEESTTPTNIRALNVFGTGF